MKIEKDLTIEFFFLRKSTCIVQYSKLSNYEIHKQMLAKPDKILIIRNDKIGDFCLSLPTFAFLKQCLPKTELHALVPEYTRPIAEACPYIDNIIIDPGKQADKTKFTALQATIRAQKFPISLTLYSTTRIGLLLFGLRIPNRFAPATKLAQFFHNHRITQRRSRSLKPEYEYNLDLSQALLKKIQSDCEFSPTSPYLNIEPSEIKQLRNAFTKEHQIDRSYLIFIHPGSGGSANNLTTEQYASLAMFLAKNSSYFIIFSAGPGEIDIAKQCSAVLNDAGFHDSHCIYESTEGLTQFVKHIAFADLFISGSTGPLHIAGALNRPTAGFYPNRQSATSLRWQTLSSDDRRLAFSPKIGTNQDDMSQLDVQQAALNIQMMLQRLYD